MALKLSTGAANAMMGTQASITALIVTDSTIAFESPSTITDSGNGFVTAGFKVGQKILCKGSSQSGNNSVLRTIATVAAGTITVVETDITTATAAANTAIAQCKGTGFADLFLNGVLRIFSGSAPATADAAETGTLLAEITNNGDAFTSGQDAAGLRFSTATAGVVGIASGQVWKDNSCDNTGTAGYFRLYANTVVTGSSTSAIRAQGTCGTSGADMNMSSTSITQAAPLTIDSAAFTFPTT